MSRLRTHPVYSVYADTIFCGHQHSTEQAALNCCRNLTMRYVTTKRFEIIVFAGGENQQTKSVQVLHRVEERCTECGRSLITGGPYEFGHYDDCPLVSCLDT